MSLDPDTFGGAFVWFTAFKVDTVPMSILIGSLLEFTKDIAQWSSQPNLFEDTDQLYCYMSPGLWSQVQVLDLSFMFEWVAVLGLIFEWAWAQKWTETRQTPNSLKRRKDIDRTALCPLRHKGPTNFLRPWELSLPRASLVAIFAQRDAAALPTTLTGLFLSDCHTSFSLSSAPDSWFRDGSGW